MTATPPLLVSSRPVSLRLIFTYLSMVLLELAPEYVSSSVPEPPALSLLLSPPAPFYAPSSVVHWRVHVLPRPPMGVSTFVSCNPYPLPPSSLVHLAHHASCVYLQWWPYMYLSRPPYCFRPPPTYPRLCTCMPGASLHALFSCLPELFWLVCCRPPPPPRVRT